MSANKTESGTRLVTDRGSRGALLAGFLVVLSFPFQQLVGPRITAMIEVVFQRVGCSEMLSIALGNVFYLLANVAIVAAVASRAFSRGLRALGLRGISSRQWPGQPV